MTDRRRPGASSRVRVREIEHGRARERPDRLATEEPLEIRLGWPEHAPDRLSVTMRTPGHDFELAAGFLLSEGLVESGADLHTVAYCTDHTLLPEERFNVVTVRLTRPPRRRPAAWYPGPASAASACGVCGKQSIEDVVMAADGAPGVRHRWLGLSVPDRVLTELPGRLRRAQRLFDSTGGLHAAALMTGDGEPVVIREDVGRHNAVDKVVGARVLARETTSLPVLCVSGRVGFEIVQKAVVAGVAVVAAVGAPTSLAVELAANAGVCIVGFLRGRRYVVYSMPDRIGV